ncbi:MAG: hypothetical protein KUA43_05345 [Hoeflea sp.]|uniref:hypothetical protein n=1 Tax=Hoeflea sp. TaxID=1940281 RepID=UPI001DA11575|nr:hypothetical protein [Hoeflea sp.]MBU4530957.1 hypothetical protein [Alphaproteobacteria bacterium]MBU4542732.1 hypothetical protein [Alphaproteobacteria bacterium]MBU4552544.1 hypothetical protein [Alphaproteobacteria bacterium]MBV1722849.1 hypothetical protein [Hoeflea sp.]MBV1762760.1 hypothetical protein [Hoeflea sp.]
MSDIGIFSTFDLMLLALIACSPGLALGAALGAWRSPGHRIRGAALYGMAGFMLAFAGWWVYLTEIK